MTGRVLVSGASVAGTAVAYWLGRHGYSVTVVERHPGLRPGGQAIDVRGPALTVLDRMGLLAAAQDRKTRIRGASFVDRDGNELSRDTESTPTGGLIDNPDIELLRDDLVELLYGATQPATEYLFDDTITAVRDDGASVAVTFERAAAGSFDLVIGADGLHSNVRSLVFGSEGQFVKPLGTHAAIFTVPKIMPRRGPCWALWTPTCASITATPKRNSPKWNAERPTTAGFVRSFCGTCAPHRISTSTRCRKS
jgi:2-polyprenyl-6-methoxyphenol hydroxylase-like FAD-dependent oxidoreductase